MSHSLQAFAVQSTEPTEGEDRLLLDRLRLALELILAGVAAVFVGALLIHPGRWIINAVQGVNLATVAAALSLLRQPSRRTRNLVIGFAAYLVTIVCTGTVGVLANDAITPVVILVGMSIVAATFVPWSPAWQLAGVTAIAATAAWNIVTLVPSPPLFWLQSVGAIAPTLASTVVISHVLRRQRAAVARAQREARGREEHLREANRRLEHEINEHRRTEGRLRFAMRELDHRVKNTLAVVQSVAEQTMRTSPSMSEFRPAFAGRIQAMASIHIALAGRRWEGLPLAELVELVVGPYRRRAESIAVRCDGTFVSSEVVRGLGMALHELATNAAKYGALSVDEGTLEVSARVESDGAPRLHVRWSEHGGPPVRERGPRGYGVKLVEEAIAYELDGRVRLELPPDGARCDIEIPLPGAGP